MTSPLGLAGQQPVEQHAGATPITNDARRRRTAPTASPTKSATAPMMTAVRALHGVERDQRRGDHALALVASARVPMIGRHVAARGGDQRDHGAPVQAEAVHHAVG